jgi:hypothetical protein
MSRRGQQAGKIRHKHAVLWVDELVLKEEEKAQLARGYNKAVNSRHRTTNSGHRTADSRQVEADS